VTPYQLTALEGVAGQLKTVLVTDLDGATQSLEADYLLPFFGLSMNLGPIATWGLNLDKSHITVNPTTSETSEEGIFAVGDVATYDHKLKLILCGFAEAAKAAHRARALVHPHEIFHFEYSTTSGVAGVGAVKTA
jgi:thioredoxin reductase (NADPH)